MGRKDEDVVYPCSSSSSTDSNPNNASFRHDHDTDSRSVASCSSSCLSRNNNWYHSKDLSTDLKLSLSISSNDLSSSLRGQYSEWPPIKAEMRKRLAGKSKNRRVKESSLFVKVYKEGIPIGRKLNLLAHFGYHPLVSTLSLMFNTTILFPLVTCHASPEENHILTYEDKEGDWMMVGDVPWELFLTTVTRLKIVVLDKCQNHT